MDMAMAMVMERGKLKLMLLADFDQLETLLTTIKSENAEATMAADRDMIFGWIRRDLGANGFRYSDSAGEQGPVKKVVFRRSSRGTTTLKVVVTGQNGALAIVPPSPSTDGYATLRFPGGDRYCVEFGPSSTVKNAGAKLWRMKKPAAGGCPP